MANAIITTWSLKCITEGCSKIITCKPRPYECPDDSAHEIDQSKTTYSLSFAASPLEDPTKFTGYYQARGINFDCPGNTTTTYNISFPHNIIMIDAYVLCEDENKGDELNIIMAPDLIVGVLTAEAKTGDTTIALSPTAVENLVSASEITLGDSNTYIVVGLDLMTSVATVYPALAADYPAMTYISRNIVLVKNLILPSRNKLSIDANGIPTFVPAGYSFRLLYTNKTSSTKNFNFYFEHY